MPHGNGLPGQHHPFQELNMRKKKALALNDLARREQQIMHVIHQLGEASVGMVLAKLPEPPSYSAVRTMIRSLEAKGLLTHRQDGKRYVYKAKESRQAASRSAIQRLLQVFFGGSAHDAVAAILDVSAGQLQEDELKRIQTLINEARAEGK
jgi:predicted transcriptional regulator